MTRQQKCTETCNTNINIKYKFHRIPESIHDSNVDTDM